MQFGAQTEVLLMTHENTVFLVGLVKHCLIGNSAIVGSSIPRRWMGHYILQGALPCLAFAARAGCDGEGEEWFTRQGLAKCSPLPPLGMLLPGDLHTPASSFLLVCLFEKNECDHLD